MTDPINSIEREAHRREQVMDKQITSRAIDAAARARSDQWSAETVRSGRGWTWDELTTEDQAKCIEWVEPIVTAALAEVEAPIKALTLREYADATRHPWTVFRRDDGSPVTVNDLMRETADRIEAGESE